MIDQDLHIKKESFGKNQNQFLIFSKTFSLKNKGFRVLKNEKGSFLVFFKDFFIEEQGF